MIYFGIIGLFFYGINVYKVIVNFQGTNCTQRPPDLMGSDLKTFGTKERPPCFNDWINPHSIANYGIERVDTVERSLMVAFLGVFWVSLALVYHRVLKVSKLIDETNDTPSDWTLMVASPYQIKNLPTDEDEQAIIDNLQRDQVFTQNSDLKIKKVSIAYNLDEYLKLSEKVNEKKMLVKKMQYKETKTKRSLSIAADEMESRPPMSLENLDRMASKLSKQLPDSIDKSRTSKKVQTKFESKDFSQETREQLYKLRDLTVEVTQFDCSWGT